MPRKFKVGDRIRVKPTSPIVSKHHSRGTIASFYHAPFSYIVDFDDGGSLPMRLDELEAAPAKRKAKKKGK